MLTPNNMTYAYKNICMSTLNTMTYAYKKIISQHKSNAENRWIPQGCMLTQYNTMTYEKMSTRKFETF